MGGAFHQTSGQLLEEALSYLSPDKTEGHPPRENTLEVAIRAAHALISPDIYIVERFKQLETTIDFATIFADQFDEKVAALIFLGRQKLLDIEHSTVESRDAADARRDLATYVEILFRLQAIEALGILYDFAASQHGGSAPQLWQTVCTRCLHLMALLPECRDRLTQFLIERPMARHRVEDLCASPNQQIAEPMREIMRAIVEIATAPTRIAPTAGMPGFIKRYLNDYNRSALHGGGEGTSMLLTAEDRIRQAVDAGDHDSVLNWMTDGSAAATRYAFRTAHSVLHLDDYIALLERLLAQRTIEPARRLATVLEIGRINRTASTKGGMPRCNKMLAETAGTKKLEWTEIAQVAVEELRNAGAAHELRLLVEYAPLIPVAEHAIAGLASIRQLPRSSGFIERRPELHSAYHGARATLAHYAQIADAAASCPSDELAMIYLRELREAQAVPELRQLTLTHGRISEIARQLLKEMEQAGELPAWMPAERDRQIVDGTQWGAGPD